MPVGIWNLEWNNHNSQRSYPLAEDAAKRDLTGTFTLPDDFILGLYFPVHAGSDVDADRFFIYSVSVFATGYNISLGYDGDNGVTIVASAVISQSAHTPNLSYALPGVGAFDDSVGKIVIGRLDSINLQPAGQFFFDYQGGKLDSDCIRPMIRGIQSIRVLNNSEMSAPMTGHVVLAAGGNFKITVAPGDGVDPATITFDAIDGAGLTSKCACEGETLPPIKTINGVGPTPAGEFALVGNQCLEVQKISNGLQLNDKCSAPCCGCAELEQITHEIEMIGAGVATVKGFVDQLAIEMNTFSQVILGSRLNDQGCVQSC